MSVIRLTAADPDRLVELADRILNAWRGYTDAEATIFAETDGVPHNTITPIARRRGSDYEIDLVLRNNLTTEEHPLGLYHPHAELHHIKKENIGLIEVMGLAVLPAEIDLVLRNNLTTEEHPLGLYHPHAELHHIKKENIGLIEVMGLAVLPARLKNELAVLGEKMVKGEDLRADPLTASHAEWAERIMQENEITADNVTDILQREVGLVFAQVLEEDLRADPLTASHAEWAERIMQENEITADNVTDILQREVGLVFAQVLEHAGVYKRTDGQCHRHSAKRGWPGLCTGAGARGRI